MMDNLGLSDGELMLGDLSKDEDMRKLIECPVCFEIPIPPIFLCKKGHIVCNSCQSKTLVCPLCKDSYTNTRSFFAEGIIEKCSIKCKFQSQGCLEIIKGVNISFHHSICEYRPYNCLECNGKPIEFAEYQEHLQNAHKLVGVHESSAFVLFTHDLSRELYGGRMYIWPQYYLNCFGRLFLFRVFFSNGLVNAWVCLLGSQKECQAYEAKITISLPSKASLTWSGGVQSFRETPENILSQGSSLSLPLNVVRKNFTNLQNFAEWIYNVRVKEVKPIKKSKS